MRALILGTSNGIIQQGYPKAIKESPFFDVVENISLGASSSLFFAYRLDGLNLKEYDVLIIESAVNDAASIRANSFRVKMLHNCYEHLFAIAKNFQIKVISIGIPGKTLDAHTFDVFDELTQIHDKFGIPFWNGLDSFLDYCANERDVYNSLFKDAAHPEYDFIYSQIADYLKCIELDDSFIPRIGTMHFEYYDIQRVLNNLDDINFDLVDYKNSLVDVTILNISSFQKAELSLPHGSKLVGIVLNSSGTSCCLQFVGKNKVRKKLNFAYDPLDTKIIVTPLVNACHVNDSKIDFFATDAIEDAERSYFANSAADLEGKLSIVGLIVETSSKI